MKVLSTSSLGIGYESLLQKDLELVLESGKITCLLGKNGTGKTTLLKTLFGEIKPLIGEVYLSQQKITTFSQQQIAKQISIVLTEKIEQVFLTVQEMVSLGRYPYLNFFGTNSNYDKKVVQEALEVTGIKKIENKLFHQLSDGEKQKVMIAKALSQTTPIIFLDEPIAFLDYPSKLQILNLLREIAQEQNKAILIVLHELDLAIRMADCLWLISKELPLLTGTPEDLILKGDFEKYFAQDQIQFDVNTGSFGLETTLKKSIEIIGGNSKVFHWLTIALNKQGYKIEVNKNYQIRYVSNDIYELFWKGIVNTCYSIQELLEMIKKNEKKN